MTAILWTKAAKDTRQPHNDYHPEKATHGKDKQSTHNNTYTGSPRP